MPLIQVTSFCSLISRNPLLWRCRLVAIDWHHLDPFMPCGHHASTTSYGKCPLEYSNFLWNRSLVPAHGKLSHETKLLDYLSSLQSPSCGGASEPITNEVNTRSCSLPPVLPKLHGRPAGTIAGLKSCNGCLGPS